VDHGYIDTAEAARHPHRHLVTQALMGDASLDPRLTVLDAKPHDRLLLCSDGLSDFVAEELLADAMKIVDLAECADRLISLALEAGGRDNVTVVVADVAPERL
jgi:serine/threonine protein phosphatase PrpC